MIIHQIEQTHFSDSEALIIQFILNKGMDIKNMTTKEIAEATFTSPSLLIRIAKKMGYDGWNQFKKAFLEELEYMYASQDIDASIPFIDDALIFAYPFVSLGTIFPLSPEYNNSNNLIQVL